MGPAEGFYLRWGQAGKGETEVRTKIVAIVITVGAVGAVPASAGAQSAGRSGLTLPPLCIKQPPLQIGYCPG